ncbi:MAG: 2-oxoacid:acceptor oxidoreductase family protein, partial [Thermodesulfobacteriota bacterium]|nr:2-oxoacid:acceptor oxidoreductase family protein [Thermodesulfobacteriota bacterium]
MGSDRSRFDIVMGGSGGQGVLTAGLLLARTGMAQYQHVSWFPSYMAAMRGGSSDCTVILSEN